jgi:hypothetical protein
MEHEAQLEKRTLHTLVHDFGFDPARSSEAIAAIGDKGDVETAIGWLLDHGEEDRGGSVALKRCPHIDSFDTTQLVLPSALRFGEPCAVCSRTGENWVCLHDGITRCSRYVHKHCIAHFNETRDREASTLTVGEASHGKVALGHHLALSLSDLSVWCYQCSSYVEHDRLDPLVARMRALKFGESSGSAHSTNVPSAQEVQLGDALCCAPCAMHGTLGHPTWSAPKVAAVSDTAARPGYRTCAAHEYVDEPDVLRAKVRLLATLLRNARSAVAYTGAGISTAAGVKDYATKGRTIATGGVSPLDVRPTCAHRVMTALHRAKLLPTWVQQNHDGLPQKAVRPVCDRTRDLAPSQGALLTSRDVDVPPPSCARGRDSRKPPSTRFTERGLTPPTRWCRWTARCARTSSLR